MPEQCLHFRPLIGRTSVCSAPSLSGTQQQQQRHLPLHQQECGSTATAPAPTAARMLHVSSNISCVTVLPTCPFQLASPPGFHVTHVPKGNLVLSIYINRSTRSLSTPHSAHRRRLAGQHFPSNFGIVRYPTSPPL